MPVERRAVTSRTPATFANGTVLASGLPGEGVQWTPPPGRNRSAMPTLERDTLPHFDAALREVGMTVQQTIHFAPAVAAAPRARDRAVLSVPPTTSGVPVVLYADESGGLSWHFPDASPRQAPGRRRSARTRTSSPATFTIDLRTAAARRSLLSQRGVATQRSLITKLGRKVFKVLVVPFSTLLGPPVRAIVERIERRHRQDLVRALGPESYRTRITEPFADWPRLLGGRALLVVHGIMSSTEGMLALLPPDGMRALSDRYAGRVIGLDQLTVSESPEENARFFLQRVATAPAGPPIEFDILCHSRGGIVARLLAERGRQLVPEATCDIRRVYFVATPNAGSPLADPAHLVDMIDVFTNLLTDFPDGPVAYSIEILLSIVKLVAVTAERSLPGVSAMGTTGFIEALNRSPARSSAIYAAAAANYEPAPAHDNGFFTGRFVDRIADRVFARGSHAVANDLVVPQASVYAANGHPSFPIAQPLLFEAADHVWHTDYFAQPRCLEDILRFFEPEGGIAPAPVA